MSTQIRVKEESSVRTPRQMRSLFADPQAEQSSPELPLRIKRSNKWSPFLVVFFVAFLLASCQKEQFSNPALNSTRSGNLQASASTNTPPEVNAGSAKRIIYTFSGPDKATLCGRVSDSEGPVTVEWTQTRGNGTALIAEPTSDTTDVSGLLPGLYTFVLTVTDNNGTQRRDSTYVTVLQKMTWTIEGTTREALAYIPTDGSGSAPLMFAYHGHGGTDLGFAERGFETNWPEAIVVYPQGLPTKTPADKAGTSSGWQRSVGEVNNKTGITDQDLKFYDAMLSTFINGYNANANQVFVHGWSNGGEFVYNALWVSRANSLTAIAPASATLSTTVGKKQIPVMHIAGTSDPKVHFSSQQQTESAVRTLDLCSSTGDLWATGPNKTVATEYNSAVSKSVLCLQYDGGHAYPFTVPPYIVEFFKEVATQ